jgi:hypothetical protein
LFGTFQVPYNPIIAMKNIYLAAFISHLTGKWAATTLRPHWFGQANRPLIFHNSKDSITSASAKQYKLEQLPPLSQ